MRNISHDEAINTICAIEDEIDITQITFRNIPIWPMVRQLLWRKLLKPHLNVFGLSESEKYTVHFPLDSKDRDKLSSFGKVDMLFVSRGQDNRGKLDGRVWNLFIDPIMELLPESLTALKLERLEEKNIDGLRFPTIPFKAPKVISSDFPRERIMHYKSLAAIVEKFAHIFLNEDLLIRDALEIEAYYELYSEILSLFQPLAVFQVCYYSQQGFGLNQASKAQRIQCVDVQHGKQGAYHAAYSHWRYFPANGWEFLPSHFINWGNSSKESIERWFPKFPASALPKAIVGGYPWLGKWMNNSTHSLGRKRDDTAFETNTTMLSPIKKLTAEKKTVILTTLQPIWDSMPEMILQAMRQSPKEWLWLVRLHQAQMDKQLEWREQIASVAGCAYDIEVASSAQLYELFYHAHCHVTAYSSCCYEALSMGIPTVLWGDRGAVIYKKEIQNSIFAHAESCEKLLSAIRQAALKASMPSLPQNNYIMTTEKIMSEAVLSIIDEGKKDTYKI